MVYEHADIYNPQSKHDHGVVFIDERLVGMQVPTVKRKWLWCYIIGLDITRSDARWEL